MDLGKITAHSTGTLSPLLPGVKFPKICALLPGLGFLDFMGKGRVRMIDPFYSVFAKKDRLEVT
jgi:hypothetical protein